MSEQKQGSEMQEMLSKAAHEVSRLYKRDNLARMLGTQTLQQREESWTESARKHSAFSEQIAGLRQAVQAADATKKEYPEPVPGVLESKFSGVKDKAARMLLTDILFARTITSPGYMDFSMNVTEEADAMVRELSAEEGLGDGKLNQVTLVNAVKSVLTGNLKLSRQTQLGDK